MEAMTSGAEAAKKAPEPLGLLRGHEAAVHCTSFLTTSSVVSGAADGVVKLWNLKTRRATSSFACHSTAGVLHCCSLDNGARFVTHGRDGLIKVWDAAAFGGDQQPVHSFRCDSYTFTKVAPRRWSSHTATPGIDQLLICPGSDAEKVLVYDMRESGSSPVALFSAPTDGTKRGMFMSLCVVEAHSHPYVVAGFEGGQLAVFDARSGFKMLCETKISSNPLLALDVAEDGASALCGPSDDEISQATIDYGMAMIDVKPFFRCNRGGLGIIRIRPDQRIFATGGTDHRVRIFHHQKLKPLAILKHHTESVFAMDFSPDNALLVSGAKDKKIALWSIYPPTGQPNPLR
ncbi:TPA: hypothetical protein N0F65_007174 [Lagenidium giganteum]|uniref:Guanine nucleotide-binding protein subunit beta-like protein n=1 Tax=Lagenidium giganteum TaxID=4803 RepID=A0AAV2Z8X1_9STRA|nr:TPA: hypothetical protein N0F65_007174 [Lagenidium giganteum]